MKRLIRKNTHSYQILKKIYRFFKNVTFASKYILDLPFIYLRSRKFYSLKGKGKIICCMSNLSIMGGAELQFKLMTQALQDLGLLKIRMTTGFISGGSSNQIFRSKSNVALRLHLGHLSEINYNKRNFLTSLLSPIFKRFNADIFHVFNPGSAPLIPLAKKAGMQIVYSEMGLPRQDPWWEPLIPYIDQIDHVISVSQAGLDSLRTLFGYKGQASVISSLIEQPPKYMIKEGSTNKPLNMIYFGRIEKAKGVDNLVRVFAEVHLQIPQTILTIIGSGPYLNEIKQLSQALNLEGQIRFIPCLEHLKLFQEVARADIYCLPSESEGCPCSILESMAIGLPVIASNVGGIPEIVIDGETGILFPKGDTLKLKEAILKLLSDHDLRAKMGAKAQQVYRERLSNKALIEKLISVYESVLLKRINL